MTYSQVGSLLRRLRRFAKVRTIPGGNLGVRLPASAVWWLPNLGFGIQQPPGGARPPGQPGAPPGSAYLRLPCEPLWARIFPGLAPGQSRVATLLFCVEA